MANRKSQIANPKVRYFGDYELLEEIARGGMGVVWKARQVSLNRLVAVKMLLSGEFAGPEFVQRFRLEAEAAANLDHPNIVSIHEVGVHDGQHYFSMDYVEGQSLAERARDNPLPPELAADYLKTIAEAIHYAHQRGILHRDLKPSNILIDPLDRPHITDFGLAKRLASTSDFGPRPSDLTLTGQVLGSPNYMPPEQAEGRQRQLTVASDVYSLGAILYHLLTGRPPFEAETLAETLQALSHTEPVSPRLLNPGVPRDLDTICLKCLEKDPRRRYDSAQHLAEELGHFLKGEPVQARPISLAGRTWRWCRRNPRVASLATATVLSVIAVAIGSPIAAYRISRQRQRADDEAAHAKRAEQETREQLWRSYLDQARANRWSGRAGRRFHSLEVLKKAAEIRPSLEVRNEAIARYNNSAAGRSTNSNVDVWDMTTGRVESFPHPDQVEGIGWHPDGVFLATACADTRVRVWDTTTGQQRSILKGHQSMVLDVQFSRRGEELFTFGTDGTLRIWDWFEERQIVSKDAIWSHSTLSSDDRWLGCGLPGGELVVLEVTAEREHRMLHIHDEASSQSQLELRFVQTGATVCASNRLFATVHADGVRLWDFSSATLTAFLPGRVYDAAVVHPDGKRLFAVGRGRLEFWSIRSTDEELGTNLRIGPPEEMPSRGWRGPLCLSQDGKMLLLCNTNVVALDSESRRERNRFSAWTNNLSLAVSPDNRWIALGNWTEPVRILDFQTGKLQQSLAREDFPGDVHLLFSPDSNGFVAGTKSEYRLWKTDDWKLIRTIPRALTGAKPGVSAFTPDGKILAVVASKELVKLQEVGSGNEIASLESPKPRLATGLAFTPDSGQLAIICGDRGLELWDLRAIRQQLAAMKLDWELPPLPPAATSAEQGPIAVTVQGATNQPAAMSWRRHLALASKYESLGLYENAVAEYEKVIELRPDFAMAYNYLAWAYVTWPPKFRSPEKALPLALKAVELSKTNHNELNTLGLVYWRVTSSRVASTFLLGGFEF